MNRYDLGGRVAVITGGARGIGLAVAKRMRASGATVVLWDLLVERLAEADQIAAMIVWMASDECSFTVGSAFDISGGRAVH